MIEQQENNLALELKPFYVYALCDPLDKKIFYVGKGTGRRAEAHINEAKRTEETENLKLLKIQEIERRSDERVNSVLVRVLGRFDTEEQAFAVESTLIHWVYGIDTLTNVAAGQGSRYIRTKDDYCELLGIDLPKKLKLKGSKYKLGETENYLAAIAKFNIEEYAEDVKAKIASFIGESNVSESYLLSSGRYYAFRVLFSDSFDIIFQFNPVEAKTIISNIVPKTEKKAVRDEFEALMSKCDLAAKNEGRYAKLDGWKGQGGVIHYQNDEEVLNRIKQAQSYFKSYGIVTFK